MSTPASRAALGLIGDFSRITIRHRLANGSGNTQTSRSRLERTRRKLIHLRHLRHEVNCPVVVVYGRFRQAKTAMLQEEIVKTTCSRDCYDACGLAVYKENGVITKVLGIPPMASSAASLWAKAAFANKAAGAIPSLAR